jgi:hypothetical protein
VESGRPSGSAKLLQARHRLQQEGIRHVSTANIATSNDFGINSDANQPGLQHSADSETNDDTKTDHYRHHEANEETDDDSHYFSETH